MTRSASTSRPSSWPSIASRGCAGRSGRTFDRRHQDREQGRVGRTRHVARGIRCLGKPGHEFAGRTRPASRAHSSTAYRRSRPPRATRRRRDAACSSSASGSAAGLERPGASGGAAATMPSSQVRSSAAPSTIGQGMAAKPVEPARPARPAQHHALQAPDAARGSPRAACRRRPADASAPPARLAGAPSGAASRAVSRRKPPGGVWSSGRPALSSSSDTPALQLRRDPAAEAAARRDQCGPAPGVVQCLAQAQRDPQRLARGIGCHVDLEPGHWSAAQPAIVASPP